MTTSMRTGSGGPPRLAERLAGLRLPRDRREFVLGDLDEEFRTRSAHYGREAASRWYWRQAWRAAMSRHPRILAAPPTTPRERTRPMSDLLTDARYALRQLRQAPGFTAAAILTLALGVGANAAVFRVAWQVILRPLPYPDADRLVRVWEAYQRGGQEISNVVAPGNFVDWKRDTQSFDAFGAYTSLRSTLDLTGAGEPMQLDTRYVTGEYFRAFNMAPLVGRVLGDDDVAAEGASPAVLSERVWRQHFGADAAVVGRSIRLDGVPHAVVGVMPEAFGVAGGSTVDVWLGLSMSPDTRTNHGAHYLGTVARLKRGVSLDQAAADVKAAAARDASAFPATNRETSAMLTTLESERGKTLRTALALLAGAAAFVLLIACANLASLQLARGLSRERELGIRTALGASRSRLVRQLIVESLVLSALGVLAGVFLSSWVLQALAGIAPVSLRGVTAAGIDWATVASAGGLGVASVALFAALPAWRTTGRAIRWIHQRVASADRRASRVRTALVTGQLALAVMLLISATLLVASLARVLRVDPGFDPTGAFAFDLTVPNGFEERDQLVRRVFREVDALPGVTASCVINAIPFDETFNMTYVPELETGPAPAAVGAFPRTVTPGCFDALRLRLVAGRLFTDHETSRVGVVTESFARRAWPAGDAVGGRVHLGVADGALIDIIGVVADSSQRSLEAPPYPQFYEVASAHSAFVPHTVIVRTTVPPESLFAAARAAVRRVDPSQPVARLRTLESVVGASLSERKFDLGLFAGFAVIALVLAGVGTYGLFAHLVEQRRSEIGIRMALGALPGSVVRLMLRRAIPTVGVGIAAGLLGVYLAADLMRHLVFSLSATDPFVYAGVAAGLAALALVAAWIPSRRAARVDPLRALRNV